MSTTEEKPLKPHSTPLTLEWLEENYELGEGVCIPRSTLYVHYIDFCNRCSFEPVNAASFGKIIRQQFPQITTRRLGNRGQSKYHYYGIAIKESSLYFEPGFAKKSVKPGTESTQETKHSWFFSPRSKIGTRLPELPNLEELSVPPDVPREKLMTLMMMYQTHCQRILDIVIRANFDEIKTYLVHFWHGLPVHIHSLLLSPYVARFISYCDLLLYRTISSVVLPSSQQTASDNFIQNLKKFAGSLMEWLVDAMQKTPNAIRSAKLKDGSRFSNHILRQISQNGIIGAARNVLQSSDVISHILDDLGPLDLDCICRQTAALASGDQNEAFEVMMRVFQDLENILEEQLTLEDFCKWLNRVIDKEIEEIQQRSGCGKSSAARQHLLLWSFFSSRVMQELLLLGAESYGSCQLLGLFLEQYAINYIDEMLMKLDADEALRELTGSALKKREEATSAEFLFDLPSEHRNSLDNTVMFPQNSEKFTTLPYVYSYFPSNHHEQDTHMGVATNVNQSFHPLPSTPHHVGTPASNVYPISGHPYPYWDNSQTSCYYSSIANPHMMWSAAYGNDVNRQADLQHV